MAGPLLNIKPIGDKIANYVNQSGLLKYDIQFIAEKKLDGAGHSSIFATFEINNETFSKAIYSVEKFDKPGIGYLSAVGRGVYSDLSNKVGYFLFHLQLLLAILSNSIKFDLDNFTDDPRRAAEGIYSLLDVHLTESSTMEKREAFTKRSYIQSGPHPAGYDLKAHHLRLSQGQMRFSLSSDSLSKWKEKITELRNKLVSREDINPEENPWNLDIINNMNKFIRLISETYSGGKKRRKRKTNKYKLKKCKSKKHRTKKPKIKKRKTKKRY